MEQQTQDKTVVIRVEGTNKAEGVAIIESIGDNIVTASGIPDGVNILAERAVRLYELFDR